MRYIYAVIAGVVSLVFIFVAFLGLLVIRGVDLDKNAGIISILLGMISPIVSSLFVLLKVQRLDEKVSNGLIPSKIEEAVNNGAFDSVLSGANQNGNEASTKGGKA